MGGRAKRTQLKRADTLDWKRVCHGRFIEVKMRGRGLERQGGGMQKVRLKSKLKVHVQAKGKRWS